jgi:RNA polymerase sigma-70 factor (ECF subfamily)
LETGERIWETAAAAAPLTPDDREEAAWLARARDGEEAAYRWLLARYRQRVVRLAAHVLRRPEDAEDAAQEAFLRAFRSLRAFRGEASFSTWLYRITLRTCADRQRRADWRAEFTAAEVRPPTEGAGAGGLDGVDLRVLVAALLDRLSPPMRAALALREVEGLEYEEIARVLEIPVGTVRSRLSAARAQFRKLWNAAMSEVNGA